MDASIVFLCGLAVLVALGLLLFSDKSKRLLDSVLAMGQSPMRVCGRFGWQWWGEMRPAAMWTKEGRCFKPLLLGLWMRCQERDRQPREER